MGVQAVLALDGREPTSAGQNSIKRKSLCAPIDEGAHQS
jgi:hypothetical protein